VPVWALISPQLIQMKLMGRMASMDNLKILIYIAVMAVPTYLIRMIPLTIIRKKIKNRFLLSFLFYMPYAVLGAMIFPAILYSTSSIYSAVIGFAAAIALSYMQKSLITVALLSSLAVFITEAVIM
jgi:branched-subunit amino acid transport protein